MSDKNDDIVQETSAYVRTYLLENLPNAYVYHDFSHADEVASVADKVAQKTDGIDKEERENVVLAAWFHDTGFARFADNRAEASAEIAEAFFREKEMEEERIAKIKQLILSTKEDAVPESPAEKALHDANISFIGRKRFSRRGQLLRMENELLKDIKIPSEDWARNMLEYIVSKKFYTPYAIDKYTSRLNKNIASQRKEIIKARKKTIRKKTGKNFGRGIDTLYRTSFRNHINLSRIADGKANMMISINTIVLSIIIAISGAGFSILESFAYDNLTLLLPMIILLLSSLTALIFAVFSARPTITGSNINEDLLKNNDNFSLLYFGNFLQVKKPEFIDYLSSLKTDQERLYDDLAKDLYNLGLVLKKKYQLLTLSYNIFVSGLIVCVLTFLVTFFVTTY